MAENDQDQKGVIVLDDAYRVEESDVSWNLVKLTPANDKNGDPKFDEDGERVMSEERLYFANLHQALGYYAQLGSKGSQSAAEAVRGITAQVDRIIEAVRPTKWSAAAGGES